MRKVADVTEHIMVVDTSLNPAHPAEPYWLHENAESRWWRA